MALDILISTIKGFNSLLKNCNPFSIRIKAIQKKVKACHLQPCILVFLIGMDHKWLRPTIQTIVLIIKKRLSGIKQTTLAVIYCMDAIISDPVRVFVQTELCPSTFQSVKSCPAAKSYTRFLTTVGNHALDTKISCAGKREGDGGWRRKESLVRDPHGFCTTAEGSVSFMGVFWYFQKCIFCISLASEVLSLLQVNGTRLKRFNRVKRVLEDSCCHRQL